MKPYIYFRAIGEQDGFGDWTDKIVYSPADILQTEEACYPYRGRYGLHAITAQAGEGLAYVRKTGLGISIPPGGSVCISYAIRFQFKEGNEACDNNVWAMNASGQRVCEIGIDQTGGFDCPVDEDDGGNVSVLTTENFSDGEWHWLNFLLRRPTSADANDGYAGIYVDGVCRWSESNIDNYNRLATLDEIRLGKISLAHDVVVDFDEIVISDRLVRPYI